MEAKWPFLLLLLFFTALTGYLISQLERSSVLSNWDKRRCDLTVMLAARFFKPDGDPRTPDEFAGDNFDFCVKQHSEAFINKLMAPITALMGKQTNLAGGAMSAMNQVREVTQRVTSAFMSYVSSYTKKMADSMVEVRRIFIYLRMAVQRMSAVAMSTIYMGMTLFSGMLSAIQTFIRVILILCAIMIAVIILLWFILLPIIPFIVTTLTAVVALVGVLSVVMSASLASQAQSQKGGFCFAEHTLIRVRRANEVSSCPLRDIQLGDILEDESMVTMVMKVSSETMEWYDVDGIHVAGDHRIHGPSGWIFVREDPRARPLVIYPSASTHVYCLNTTSRCIPLRGQSGLRYDFRDWEEFEEADEEGHRLWGDAVLRLLGSTEESVDQDIPLVGSDVEIKTPTGWTRISLLCIGDEIVTRKGTERVMGIVRGRPSSISGSTHDWIQGGYEWDTVQQQWRPYRQSKTDTTVNDMVGFQLITPSGEWIARTLSGIVILRDFTEVGHEAISHLYDLVGDRLGVSQ